MGTIFKYSLFSKFLVALASTLLTILTIEVTFHLIGFDFDRKLKAFEAMPVYYRQPIAPVGEVFFRRPGPDIWKGKVLSTGVKRSGIIDKEAYTDESDVTITYDRQGFRNPEDLTDWDIVVIGDSMVELGFLPYKDLFTTQIGKLLGVRVKNLGVSYTGPLTHIFYLKRYGISPSTKHVILAFFEGNDIEDLLREDQWLQTFRKTGKREYRTIEKQTSFIKAIYRYLHTTEKRTQKIEILAQNAFLKSCNEEVGVSVFYCPPGKDQLSPKQKALLENVLSEWSTTAKNIGVTPWIVYMPSKHRVLDGYLRFTENSTRELINCKPSDLPDFIKHISENNDIGFIDVTPALAMETKNCNLTYNLIWDTHLNRKGSLIVAQVIADKLIKSHKE